MITQLINDIAYDKIELSQALTRVKLIASTIKNETLKVWLKKELEGYEFDDPALPEYRVVWTDIHLTIDLPFGQRRTLPIHLKEPFNQDTIDLIHNLKILESISIIEERVKSMDDGLSYLKIPTNQVQLLADLFKTRIAEMRGAAREAHREISRIHFSNILVQTKQKLLDTLISLNEEFPDLIDKYAMTKENNEKVQNIVTTNIYGGNNPLNIAAGVNIEQTMHYGSLSSEDEGRLRSYGVDQGQIDELKTILTETKQLDKSTFKSKVMKWLGGVTASVAGKGLYDNLPAITEFVNNLL